MLNCRPPDLNDPKYLNCRPPDLNDPKYLNDPRKFAFVCF